MMKRSSGLKRTAFKRPERPARKPQPVYKLERRVNYAAVTQEVRKAPKENLVVSEAYRKLVRQLPCMHCGIQGFTQFCHSDQGKGMGLKTDDRRGWPGCGPRDDEPGCHWLISTSGRIPRERRRALEDLYASRTRAAIVAAGAWPKKLPRWEEPADA